MSLNTVRWTLRPASFLPGSTEFMRYGPPSFDEVYLNNEYKRKKNDKRIVTRLLNLSPTWYKPRGYHKKSQPRCAEKYGMVRAERHVNQWKLHNLASQRYYRRSWNSVWLKPVHSAVWSSLHVRHQTEICKKSAFYISLFFFTLIPCIS